MSRSYCAKFREDLEARTNVRLGGRDYCKAKAAARTAAKRVTRSQVEAFYTEA